MTMIISGDNGLTYPNSTVQASAGVVLQVVNFVLSTQTSTTSSSYVDTGLTASITPKFNTSKILVLVSQVIYSNPSGSTTSTTQLQRNGTAILTEGYSAYIADQFYRSVLNYLDSPATTSTLTYKVQMKKSVGGSPAITYSYGDGGGQTNCEITLMEIAG